jgi:hypothetical protein
MGKSWTPAPRRNPRQPAAPSKKALTAIPINMQRKLPNGKLLQFLLTRVE